MRAAVALGAVALVAFVATRRGILGVIVAGAVVGVGIGVVMLVAGPVAHALTPAPSVLYGGPLAGS